MISIEKLARDAGLGRARQYLLDWNRVESEMGTSLPSDYKEYVYWFGPGHIEDFLYIYVPGVEDENINLAYGPDLIRESFNRRGRLSRQMNMEFRQPYPIFPEKCGWLPWGHTIDGDHLFWVTSRGEPDDWTIAASSRGDEIGYFNGGFMDFLHSYIWDTGEVDFFPREEGAELPFRFYPFDGA